MTSAWTVAEIEARITTLKAQWDEATTAISAILGGAQSYTLDTGQTRQVVTRANLSEIRCMRDALWEEIEFLQSQLTGSASYVARPGWG